MDYNGSGNEEPEQLRKMFLGGLSFDTNEDSIRDYFKSYGEIVDCCVVVDKDTKKPRGFGFVTFSNSESVEKVMRAKKEAPHALDGRDIDVKRALSKEDAGPKEPVTKAFVGGLAPETTEEDLREHFSKFGNVIEVTIPKRSNEDKKRGFGFVSFEDSDSVDCIIIKGHHDPHIIHDRQLDVKKAVPKDRDGGRFGGPRGGRGRGRGGRDFRGGYGNNRGGYRSGGGDYGGSYGGGGGRYQQSGYGSYGGGQGGGSYGGGSYGGSGYHSSGYDNSGGGGGYNDFGSGYGSQNSSYGPMKGGNSGYRNNPYSGGGYGGNSGGGGGGGSSNYGYGGSYNSSGGGRNSNYY
ncbi:heterogeneous nuclear ribonucleoprotein A1-like 2 isoform X1 [Diadema setosum]|uniref:heterogeneous nuclear ribonucleoprotein A1-like 2 isoform X1 n=1 Tax=Diadema setosum TaxID=31175 RepID=UPI003B3B906A